MPLGDYQKIIIRELNYSPRDLFKDTQALGLSYLEISVKKNRQATNYIDL